MPAPLTDSKCQCHSSDQGVLVPKQEEEETAEFDNTPKECPHWKHKEGRLAAKVLKEPHQEAFFKELKVIKVARQMYHKTCWFNFKHKGSYDLSSTFWQMATSTNFLGMEIYEMKDNWGGQKGLQAANQAAKTSPKYIYFFRMVIPMESPKIMGLKGTHLPKALWQWSSLTFCPLCAKEGQNEGTVVNYLYTMHYHLSIMCAQCLEYFTMSADAMQRHALLCRPSATGDNNDDDWEEEDFEDDDNGDKDDELIFND